MENQQVQEIIKNKNVNLERLKFSFEYYEGLMKYNDDAKFNERLTSEEYKILKEVFHDDK